MLLNLRHAPRLIRNSIELRDEIFATFILLLGELSLGQYHHGRIIAINLKGSRGEDTCKIMAVPFATDFRGSARMEAYIY